MYKFTAFYTKIDKSKQILKLKSFGSIHELYRYIYTIFRKMFGINHLDIRTFRDINEFEMTDTDCKTAKFNHCIYTVRSGLKLKNIVLIHDDQNGYHQFHYTIRKI